jgi:hypothetical protein
MLYVYTSPRRSKDEANSWCQEIRKLLGPPGPGEEFRNPPGNHPISAERWVFLDPWCTSEEKEKKKKTKILSCFFLRKSLEKNSFLVFKKGSAG